MVISIRCHTSLLCDSVTIMEALGIIIYKHDFDRGFLRPLQPILRKAVTRVLDLMLDEVSHECRQQALSVVQAYIKRYYNSLVQFIPYACCCQ